MTTTIPSPRGFEYEGRFYAWHVSDLGKDLMLMDRICGLSLSEFFAALDDPVESGRAPILLTMIGTSIRYANPDWSVERLVRTITGMNLGDVVFVDADEEEEAPLPPASESDAATPRLSDALSTSPRSDSSPSSTPPEISRSQTSSAIRA